MRRRERYGRIEVGPGIPTPDVSGDPPASQASPRLHDGGIVKPRTTPVIGDGCNYPMPSQISARLEFKRPMSETDMEAFVTEWGRQLRGIAMVPRTRAPWDDLDVALAAEEHGQRAGVRRQRRPLRRVRGRGAETATGGV